MPIPWRGRAVAIPGQTNPVAGKEVGDYRSFNLEGYTQELDHWLAAVGRLKDDPGEAARLREQLPTVWVVLADGQRFELSTNWLRLGLETVEKNRSVRSARIDLLMRQLEALRRDARVLAEPPPFAAASARQKLQEILARREFRGVHGPTWLDHLLRRLNRWLSDLYDRLTRRVGNHPEAGQVLFWGLLLVAAGWLLVWMVRRLLQRPGEFPLGLTEAPPISATWQQMAQQARAAAGRGDFRDAIRLAYWAGIARLEDLGLWTADRARTHREYLRLLGVHQPQREPFAVLTRQFERAWYAGRPASAEDFQTVLGQLEKLGCVFPSTPAIERS